MISRIEEILIEGKKEILPNEDLMLSILNQIPEKKNNVSEAVIKSPYSSWFINFDEIRGKTKFFKELYSLYNDEKNRSFNEEVRQINKPYLRIAFTQVISLCLLLVIVYPTYEIKYSDFQIEKEFLSIDSQVEEFEEYMDNTDFEESLVL